LFFPILVPPYTNGWTFTRRPLPADHDHHHKPGLKIHEPELADGLISSENGRAPPFRHGDGAGGKYVMGDQEGLTDDEEGGGGWMDYDY
jgi:palmitoyltransferase